MRGIMILQRVVASAFRPGAQNSAALVGSAEESTCS